MHIYPLSHKDSYKNRVHGESGKAINCWGARVCFSVCIISGFCCAARFLETSVSQLHSVCNGMIISHLVTSQNIKLVINFDKYIISLCSFHICYWHNMHCFFSISIWHHLLLFLVNNWLHILNVFHVDFEVHNWKEWKTQ